MSSHAQLQVSLGELKFDHRTAAPHAWLRTIKIRRCHKLLVLGCKAPAPPSRYRSAELLQHQNWNSQIDALAICHAARAGLPSWTAQIQHQHPLIRLPRISFIPSRLRCHTTTKSPYPSEATAGRAVTTAGCAKESANGESLTTTGSSLGVPSDV